MKAILEEYGKVLIASLLAIMVIAIIFGGGTSLMNKLATVKAEATVEQETQISALHAISTKDKPLLEAYLPALKHGSSYDLTSFVTYARPYTTNKDVGERKSLSVEVVELLDPDGKDITNEISIVDGKPYYAFSLPINKKTGKEEITEDNYKSVYKITYKTVDTTDPDIQVSTMKTYNVVVK